MKIIVRAMLNTCFDVFGEYRLWAFQITWDNHNSISFLLPPKVWKVFFVYIFWRTNLFSCLRTQVLHNGSKSNSLTTTNLEIFLMKNTTYSWKSYLYLPDKRRCCFRSSLKYRYTILNFLSSILFLSSKYVFSGISRISNFPDMVFCNILHGLFFTKIAKKLTKTRVKIDPHKVYFSYTRFVA